MLERTWMRSSNSRSDNLKSKIENPKCMRLLALVLTFKLCGAVVHAQANFFQGNR